ncbi:hypothetical protein I6F21_30745 [Bradyrhizobium sp. NBAIM03]|uniref:hypothetical protein n=1 Tax=Bradyrhizobium TaxID=374 RepID=UPI001CD1AFF4|nr:MULTISPECIES: hypothetical protein [unclassified Bradyrhizobium]MCA1536904.1 hypothetical protein [Bradyrhizobium sp. NBAIM03]MCA1551581.1 hypothetical protein [Bradyrhizobium sp. BRP19]
MSARYAVNEMANRIVRASGNDVSAERCFREYTACTAELDKDAAVKGVALELERPCICENPFIAPACAGGEK